MRTSSRTDRACLRSSPETRAQHVWYRSCPVTGLPARSVSAPRASAFAALHQRSIQPESIVSRIRSDRHGIGAQDGDRALRAGHTSRRGLAPAPPSTLDLRRTAIAEIALVGASFLDAAMTFRQRSVWAVRAQSVVCGSAVAPRAIRLDDLDAEGLAPLAAGTAEQVETLAHLAAARSCSAALGGRQSAATRADARRAALARRTVWPRQTGGCRRARPDWCPDRSQITGSDRRLVVHNRTPRTARAVASMLGHDVTRTRAEFAATVRGGSVVVMVVDVAVVRDVHCRADGLCTELTGPYRSSG